MPIIQLIDAATEHDVRGVEPEEWSNVPRVGDHIVIAHPVRHVRVVAVTWIKAESLFVRLVVEDVHEF